MLFLHNWSYDWSVQMAPLYEKWVHSILLRADKTVIIPLRLRDKAKESRELMLLVVALPLTAASEGNVIWPTDWLGANSDVMCELHILCELERLWQFISSHAGKNHCQQTIWKGLAAGGFDWRCQRSAYQRRVKREQGAPRRGKHCCLIC